MSKEEDIHREQLGELTRDEVQKIIWHLEFCDRLSRDYGTGHPEPGELADKLTRLLKRVDRRVALYALEKGQCEMEVDGVRCGGIAGHEGACWPFEGSTHG